MGPCRANYELIINNESTDGDDDIYIECTCSGSQLLCRDSLCRIVPSYPDILEFLIRAGLLELHAAYTPVIHKQMFAHVFHDAIMVLHDTYGQLDDYGVGLGVGPTAMYDWLDVNCNVTI